MQLDAFEGRSGCEGMRADSRGTSLLNARCWEEQEQRTCKTSMYDQYDVVFDVWKDLLCVCDKWQV